MISLSTVEPCKALTEVLAHLIPGGVALAMVEDDTILWSKKSDTFNLNIFKVGTRISSNITPLQAIRERDAAYDQRLTIVSIPIVKDNEESDTTSFPTAFPRIYTMAAAYGDYASVLTGMFPEGSFVYMSDLENMAFKQATSKADMATLTVGHICNENDISFSAIKLTQKGLTEADIANCGTTVFIAIYPLYNAENKEESAATLGIITPKKKAFIREINKISKAI